MPHALARYAIALALIFSVSVVTHAGAATNSACAKDDAQNIGYGASILCPDAITGAWEDRLKSGDTFGLAIGMLATVPGATKFLTNQNKRIRFIRIQTYLRHGDQTKRTLWYTDLPGDFSWRSHHLRLHQPGPDYVPSIDAYVASLDLDWVFARPRNRWTGTVRSLGVAGTVTLVRSSRSDPEAPIGIWQVSRDLSHVRCLHVMMSGDGQLVLWSDYLSIADNVPYANLATVRFPPAPIDESYGEFLNDPRARRSGNHWVFAEGNGLWREDLDGELDSSGMVFAGTFTHSGNGFVIPGPRPFKWDRISGTCGDIL